MANNSGNAYALTILSPIKHGHLLETAFADVVRGRLEGWNSLPNSPMTKVKQTYLCRYFVLDDVYTESTPGTDLFGTIKDIFSIVSNKVRVDTLPKEEHLKSKYLVFSSNFHGDLDAYLTGMWSAMSAEITAVWGFCYGFEQVRDAASFIVYMKKCQLDAALFFVGATDDTLEEQLKSLYLKQQFTKFAMRTQGMPAAQLQQEYKKFILEVEPGNLAAPSWLPGQYRLDRTEKAMP